MGTGMKSTIRIAIFVGITLSTGLFAQTAQKPGPWTFFFNWVPLKYSAAAFKLEYNITNNFSIAFPFALAIQNTKFIVKGTTTKAGLTETTGTLGFGVKYYFTGALHSGWFIGSDLTFSLKDFTGVRLDSLATQYKSDPVWTVSPEATFGYAWVLDNGVLFGLGIGYGYDYKLSGATPPVAIVRRYNNRGLRGVTQREGFRPNGDLVFGFSW